MADDIPFIDQPLVIRRQKLKNNNFTIICQNCMAGIIYHQLGMKFLTPTVNLYFEPTDFMKFVHNLHYFMQSEVV